MRVSRAGFGGRAPAGRRRSGLAVLGQDGLDAVLAPKLEALDLADLAALPLGGEPDPLQPPQLPLVVVVFPDQVTQLVVRRGETVDQIEFRGFHVTSCPR